MSKQTEQNEPALTTVKTIYARAAIILLALNFAFTGYLTYSMNKTQSETLDNLQNAPTPQASANLRRQQASDETAPKTLGN
jgi:predicted RND superfamily exporter protein